MEIMFNLFRRNLKFLVAVWCIDYRTRTMRLTCFPRMYIPVIVVCISQVQKDIPRSYFQGRKMSPFTPGKGFDGPKTFGLLNGPITKHVFLSFLITVK
ncbi:hypothetical protein Ahy_B07g086657 isoform E [Arachis hypogaea]|uniref:Uncharacterized protein n=1 Tax=Arachis hypogaea TaxID=3818 RepID=A0A444YA91_ARAHY|nr:hypothetical protein Ahy_B07g086657 isoform E [Arachis hypogaea]